MWKIPRKKGIKRVKLKNYIEKKKEQPQKSNWNYKRIQKIQGSRFKSPRKCKKVATTLKLKNLKKKKLKFDSKTGETKKESIFTQWIQQ